MCMLTSTEIELRFAQEEDLPQIIDLCKAHAAYENASYDQQNKSERLSSYLLGPDPGLKCLVVAQQNILVGYATFMRQFSTWDADWYIYLDCLYLKENARGRGLGKLIMEKISAYALTQNCKMIQWQTPAFNKKAIQFYENIGAVSKAKERFFWVVDGGET